jgi:CBS domain containing-hemolysin-like protein
VSRLLLVAAASGDSGGFPGVPASLVLILLLIAGSGLFSGAETALVSANRARLEALATQGKRAARRAVSLLSRLEGSIATILVGTNVCNISASAVATALAVRLSPEHGTAWATAIMTPLVLITGEILPKAFFRSRPTRRLQAVSGFLRLSEIVLAPLVAVAGGSARGLLAVVRVPASERRAAFRRSDLEYLFAFGVVRREPVDARVKRETVLRMAGRTLDLRNRTVADAAVPADPERTISAAATVGEARERFRRSRAHVLLALDARGEITGCVPAKAILGMSAQERLDRHVQPAQSLAAGAPLDEVIRGLRRHPQAIGLVRDEGGRTLGVVSAEDLLAEIVGKLPTGEALRGARH